MNKYTIIIAQVCAILLALIMLILLAIDGGVIEADADGVPPEVDTGGLCYVRQICTRRVCYQQIPFAYIMFNAVHRGYHAAF